MKDSFKLFSQNMLVKELNKNELETLFSISKEVCLEPGKVLMNEGDRADEIFFILEGSLEISKYDPVSKEKYVIGTVTEGNAIGEMALLDRGPRSASATVLTKCRLRKIAYADLLSIVEKHSEYNSLVFQMARNVSQHLRQTSDVVIETLKAKVEEYKTRNHMGFYLIILITGLCVIAYSIPGLQWALSAAPNSSYVSIPIIVVLGLTMYLSNKLFRFSPRALGITLVSWKQSLFEGFFFTIPILGLLTLLKWLAIQFLPAFKGSPLFNPFYLIQDAELQDLSSWLHLQLYYILFVPIQELIARGGLQGVLERFLIGTRKVPMSIFISSLMFSTAHLFLSTQISFVIFAVGLYFGWLYSRTHNLISPIIGHILIGVWGLSVLGF